jgi:hypothetical protein
MMTERLETEITLNRIAQGHVLPPIGIEWFETFHEAEQRGVLRILVHMVLQAGGSSQDVAAAIEEAGLKTTYTSCVLLTNGALNVQLAKAVQLPRNELTKLFSLLIALLKIADNRRRMHCRERCRHWWHWDLADEGVIDEIRREHSRGAL